MSQDNGSATALTAVSNGRPIKFTPERFEQIRNLIERGKTREEIAELIGSTVGSLQVTCSRLGISLRIPRQLRPQMKKARMEPKEIAVTECRRGESTIATISLLLNCNGRTREMQLSLDSAAVIKLIFEAQFRSMSLSDLIAAIIHSSSQDDKLLASMLPRCDAQWCFHFGFGICPSWLGGLHRKKETTMNDMRTLVVTIDRVAGSNVRAALEATEEVMQVFASLIDRGLRVRIGDRLANYENIWKWDWRQTTKRQARRRLWRAESRGRRNEDRRSEVLEGGALYFADAVRVFDG
jgi:hypothetical protein